MTGATVVVVVLRATVVVPPPLQAEAAKTKIETAIDAAKRNRCNVNSSVENSDR
jgi:hypothetical protein